jgi:hypothetical protein
MTDEPKLPLTVPLMLWSAVAEGVYPAFADSYLSGASLEVGKLRAKTFTAYDRITGNFSAMNVLKGMDITPICPDGTAPRISRARPMTAEERADARVALARTIASLKAGADRMKGKRIPPPPVQARTGETGISAELAERLGLRGPAPERFFNDDRRAAADVLDLLD